VYTPQRAFKIAVQIIAKWGDTDVFPLLPKIMYCTTATRTSSTYCSTLIGISRRRWLNIHQLLKARLQQGWF
jgi:hypothetical protein